MKMRGVASDFSTNYEMDVLLYEDGSGIQLFMDEIRERFSIKPRDHRDMFLKAIMAKPDPDLNRRSNPFQRQFCEHYQGPVDRRKAAINSSAEGM